MNYQVAALARTTFLESIRSKVLYAVLFFGALMVGVSALFGAVTIGDQLIVIKDFGLMAASLMTTGFTIIAGTTLLHKELFRKTIYNILSKSVTRTSFILGKYLGLLATAISIMSLMVLGLELFLFPFQGSIDGPVAVVSFYIALELVILCAVALFFSAIVVTPLLSGLFTFGVFLAGRSTDYIHTLIQNSAQSGDSSVLLTTLYYLLPHLSELNVANEAAYGVIPSTTHILWAGIYSCGYAAILLALTIALFNRRDFNQ